MMSMIKSTIEGIPVEMTVEETIGSTMGGYPTLHIGLQDVMVKEVDVLEVYKAVATSGTVEEFCERVTGTWEAWKYQCAIKACALESMGGGIIADCVFNDKILKEIDRICEYLDDPSVPRSLELQCLGKLYDLHKQLKVIE